MPSSFIYVGNLAEMDTNEQNYTNENLTPILKTFTHSEMEVVDVTMSNYYDASFTFDNDWGLGADNFTYDVGAGTVVSDLDSEGRYFATVIDETGATQSVTISIYQTANGDVFFKLPDGLNVSSVTVTGLDFDDFDGITYGTSSTATVVCFTKGTLIETPGGPVRVEGLEIGDYVTTLDHAAQPIRWLHRQYVQITSKSAPIRVAAGALGAGLPTTDLCVSPQHRLMLRSKIAERMFASAEVLISAKKLVGLPGITSDLHRNTVTYIHFACDAHEIVFANGAPCETLLTGPQARIALSRRNQKTLNEALNPPHDTAAAARPVVEGRLAISLIARHVKNQRPILVVNQNTFSA